MPDELAGIDEHGRVRVIGTRNKGGYELQIIGTRMTCRTRSYNAAQRLAVCYGAVEIRARHRVA